MPKPQSTIFPRHQKERLETNNDQTNVTYQTNDVPKICHNHEERPSQCTKRRRDEEQIMTKQTPHIKPKTFPGNATITKHGLPDAPKEGEMNNDKTNAKYNHRRTKGNRGTVSRKTMVEDGEGWRGGAWLKPVLLARNIVFLPLCPDAASDRKKTENKVCSCYRKWSQCQHHYK